MGKGGFCLERRRVIEGEKYGRSPRRLVDTGRDHRDLRNPDDDNASVLKIRTRRLYSKLSSVSVEYEV